MTTAIKSSITPAEFGALHRTHVQALVDPKAVKVASKSLNDKVMLELAYSTREAGIADAKEALRGVMEEAGKRSMPLKDAYALDEKLATAVAAQAAKSTGGKLTPLSARFLPIDFRAHYEQVTGAKIEDKDGIAVPGVKVDRSGTTVTTTIDFKKALEGATAMKLVLAIADHYVLHAKRVDGPLKDPSLPPYYLVIGAREGHTKPGTSIKSGNGSSTFSADPHHMIFAGASQVELQTGYAGTTYETLEFKLDGVNWFGEKVKPPSEATKPARAAWGAVFNKGTGAFDLAAAIAAGTIQPKKREDVEGITGMKTLLSEVRAQEKQSISKLVTAGVLSFGYDTTTKTIAVVRGGTDGYLAVVDPAKHRTVGVFTAKGAGKDAVWEER